jgi:MFS family permease
MMEHAALVGFGEYRLYPQRFFMLFIYGCIGCLNNAIWVAYTPITSTAEETYHTSQSTIDLLAATYLLTTIFLTPVGSWLCDVKGVRTVVVVCGILNTVGAWIKYISFVFDDPHTSLAIVFVGQMFCAVAQPLFIPAPPKLAALWFGEDERTLATGIGSLSVVSGIALGYGLAISLVGDEDDCCSTLNLTLAILVTVPSIMGFIFFREQPETPPSPSAESFRDDFMDSFRSALKEKAFLVLLCTISPGYGILTAVFSLIGDLAAGKGYSEETSGLIGVVMVLGGLLGAVVLGGLLDETKRYFLLIRVSFFFAAIFLSSFIISMEFEAPPWVVYLTSGLAGFFLLALLPMCIEFGVEVTYPCTEGVVSGLILLTGNLYGLAFFFFLQALIRENDVNSTGDTNDLNSSLSLWFIMFAGIAVCIGGFFIFGETKRLNFERGKSSDVHTGSRIQYH